jgi:formylglycine-generating enzyme required for sulfatase activity/predicted Ser/Thr protein kinase
MSSKPANIGKYEIVSELGSGSMGVVYKAKDNINRFIALKILGGMAFGSDADDLRLRFKTEAIAAAKLGHQNIVRIYEYSEHEGQPFIAMEYVEGCTLSDMIERREMLELGEVCRIILSVLDGLNYAHKQGVVHRDIKPANIMIDRAGEVKIADFGIARIEHSTQTVLGTVMGTAGYMPPEQIRGEQVDRRADIFPVGVMLFELLTGVRAFEGNSFHETSMKVISDELPQISRLCPTISKDIDWVVEKAVAKKAADRFQTAAEFADALRNLDEQICSQGEDETVLQVRPDTGIAETAPNVEVAEQVQLAAIVGELQSQGCGTDSPNAKTVVEPARQSGEPERRGAATPGSRITTETPDYKKFATIALGLLAVLVSGYYLLPGLITSEPTAVVDNTEILGQPAGGQEETLGDIAPRIVPAPVPVPEYTVGKQFSDCDVCPEMRVIPAGSFLQGAQSGDAGREQNAETQHAVTFAGPLGVGVTEVTRGQFARFVAETGYEAAGCTTYDGEWNVQPGQDWRSPGFMQNDNHPVTCVSWEDATAYTRWLAGKTEKKYRLLSESEWEYVARAGTTSSRSWGDSPDSACTSANVADMSAGDTYQDWKIHECKDRFTHTAPAGEFEANAFGVKDMMGNVFEWVEDCWAETYDPAAVDGSASTEGDCSQRVLRGGSWYTRPQFVRSSARNRFPRDHRSSAFGFRVARQLGSS